MAKAATTHTRRAARVWLRVSGAGGDEGARRRHTGPARGAQAEGVRTDAAGQMEPAI